MEKINDIIVMRLIYMSYAAFNLGTYQHKDSRIQDEYTKVAIEVGKKVVNGCADAKSGGNNGWNHP